MTSFSEKLKNFFKKLAGRLLRTEDSAPLDDHSFRQINIFSKNPKAFIVYLPDKKENLIGNIEDLPDNVKKTLIENFVSDEPRKEELPNIRVIKSDRRNFNKEIIEFQHHYEKKDDNLDNILTYLNPEYVSILKLSSYVKEKYDAGENRKAQKIKADIGNQYGRDGRKLCNLYTKSYIIEMVSVYINKISESTKDKKELSLKFNTLFNDIIRFSEYIFFIHSHTNKSDVKNKIILGMKLKKPYIALHSAGLFNISITEKILKQIGDDIFNKYNYLYKQEKQKSSGEIAFFDVYIMPGE